MRPKGGWQRTAVFLARQATAARSHLDARASTWAKAWDASAQAHRMSSATHNSPIGCANPNHPRSGSQYRLPPVPNVFAARRARIFTDGGWRSGPGLSALIPAATSPTPECPVALVGGLSPVLFQLGNVLHQVFFATGQANAAAQGARADPMVASFHEARPLDALGFGARGHTPRYN